MSTSDPNISRTVSHSIINNILFWKLITRPFRCIYVNCFNIDLDFLLKSAQNHKKCIFLDDLLTITWEGNMETKQMARFLSKFSALTVFNIHFWIWKYSKFIFVWSPFWYILVWKIPHLLAKNYQFGQLIVFL